MGRLEILAIKGVYSLIGRGLAVARQLQKATLYFLALEDPAGGPVPPFYKIGTTTDTVDKRIRQLQTGNPFRIVPHRTFEVEGAELVERHLHRLFTAKRRLLEWFTLSEDELEEVIEEARVFADEVEELVVEVRDLDQTHSTDVVIDPTPEMLDLHSEALRLEALKTQNKLRSSAIKSQLMTLTGTSRGIQGITRVNVYKPKETFKKMLLKGVHPDLYDQYLTKSMFKHAMSVLERAKPSDFRQLYDANKQASAAAPVVEPNDVTGDYEDRSAAAIAIHEEYLRVLGEDGAVERDLLLVKMMLKAHCGTARGIDGVCTYVREDRMAFDEEQFKDDHPNLHDDFTTTSNPQRRAFVWRSRDY